MPETWVDPSSGWKATGYPRADGGLTGVTVEDPNGITRARGLYFTSEQDFSSWIKQLTRRPLGLLSPREWIALARRMRRPWWS